MTDLASTLLALERQLLEAPTRHDAARVAALLSDAFVEFGSSGRVWTKPAILEALQAEPPTDRRLLDFQATPLGPDVALVTYRVERAETPPVATLRSSLWVREDGQWRMRFHQGTPTAR